MDVTLVPLIHCPFRQHGREPCLVREDLGIGVQCEGFIPSVTIDTVMAVGLLLGQLSKRL